MSDWLVVPVKSLRDGKSRLSPALGSTERRAFMKRLLVRTLEQAAHFPGLQQTLFISACEEARVLASAYGARALQECAPGGLNRALRQAQRVLSEFGATRMLMISSDLPLVRAQDLQHLASALSADTIVLAPDRTRQGTNGLCLDPSLAFDFSFGPNSFERHLESVRRLHMQSAIVERVGLAFDVDIPDHLAELRVERLPSQLDAIDSATAAGFPLTAPMCTQNSMKTR